MKLYAVLFAFVLTICGGSSCQAQTSLAVVDLSPAKGRITTQTLRSFSIINTDDAVTTVSFFVSLEHPSTGEPIATITSRPFTLSSGQTNGLADVPWLSQVFYGEGSAAAGLARRGVLEYGSYVVCLSVLGETGGSLLERCFEKISIPVQNLSLVYPLDRSCIMENRPTLAWQDVLGLSSPGLTYSLTLVEMAEGKSAAWSLRQSLPLLHRQYLKKNTLAYPIEAPKLKVGPTYVWEVKASNTSGEFLSSQQWTFQLSLSPSGKKNTTEQSYALLRSSSTGQPHIFGEEILLAFDNNESVKELNYTIFDVSEDQPIKKALPRLMGLQPGLNTLDIPITNLGLKPNHLYQIAVNTPRKHTYTLDFKIAK